MAPSQVLSSVAHAFPIRNCCRGLDSFVGRGSEDGLLYEIISPWIKMLCCKVLYRMADLKAIVNAMKRSLAFLCRSEVLLIAYRTIVLADADGFHRRESWCAVKGKWFWYIQ